MLTLQLLCLELATGDIPTDGQTSSWLTDSEPDDLIAILWGIGFLVAQPIGDNRSVDEVQSFLGAYQAPYLNIAAAHNFRIHPMFWAYLGLEVENTLSN